MVPIAKGSLQKKWGKKYIYYASNPSQDLATSVGHIFHFFHLYTFPFIGTKPARNTAGGPLLPERGLMILAWVKW